jgi:cysteine synthase
MLPLASGVAQLVGNTPLVRLAAASAATGCDIYGKCEFLNPGGSVKDRAALSIIEDAERQGILRPGGLIVEGTAGNTGIGLALIGNAKGYRTTIVIPETQSQEKKDTLRALGAELVEVAPTAYSNPAHYVHTSRRIAEETDGALWSNQFDNTANRRAHIQNTAPEIWAQTDGTIDGFTCAVGTGGTLAGVGLGLKERNAAVTIALTDPHGAALFSHYRDGELRAEGTSVAEGIGQSRVTANLEGAPVDLAFRVGDQEGLDHVFSLLRDEGMCVGLSSGINVAGAVALARELGPGKTIVTILCDSGLRYLSTLFNPAWLTAKGLAVPDWLSR